MRPETFENKMNIAIRHWITTRESNKLKSLMRPALRVWRKYARDENDYRSGVVTYGYEDTESVENNMMYISDRWRCAFRLKWIIDGVNSGKI